MTHSFRSHYFHLVWSTKNRRPLITREIKSELYPYMSGIAKNSNVKLLEINGMPDHVHLLLELGVPDHFTSVVRTLKANSSSFIRKRFSPANPFAWQEGYGSFSVSVSNIERVRSYIRNQAKHHVKFSFEEEFKMILKRHQIQYDDRFVFG